MVTQAQLTELNDKWNKIQSLVSSDPLQASILYDKYKKEEEEIVAEIPPDHSHIIDDQAVS